ncbi:MAG: sugar kinase [Bacillota bacterium]|nr:sugar kinase [Bacillota bacterium]
MSSQMSTPVAWPPQPRVVTLGESMVVLNPATTGPLRYVHTFHRSLAGAESNVAIGLVRLGIPVGWFSRVGGDEFGRYVLATLRGEEVDVSRARTDADAPTGVYFKELRAAGDPSVYYYRRGSAASRLSPDDLDPAYIASAELLHITGITPALSDSCRRTVLRAVEIARASGTLVSFDPNYRAKLWSPDEARPVMREIARQADIVMPGLAEAELLTGAVDPTTAAGELLAAGARLVVVKLGPAGAMVAAAAAAGQGAGAAPETVPGFAATPVDSIGAGDAFAAAFLAGILSGCSPVNAARQANAAGALATQVVGDWEGMPDREALDRFMAGREAVTR